MLPIISRRIIHFIHVDMTFLDQFIVLIKEWILWNNSRLFVMLIFQNCLKFWTITYICPSLAPDIDIVYMSFVSDGKESTIT